MRIAIPNEYLQGTEVVWGEVALTMASDQPLLTVSRGSRERGGGVCESRESWIDSRCSLLSEAWRGTGRGRDIGDKAGVKGFGPGFFGGFARGEGKIQRL